MLAKFPPNSVKMKQPFGMQPWDSSIDISKKLFKVHIKNYGVDSCLFSSMNRCLQYAPSSPQSEMF